ncbi:MAG: galactose mutarotase [Oscillospiraceae bacterium]|jgi:aldose 1-epimerase|nr:galactose mutarotase [Oscillospiraceae bacterium]
MSIKSERYGQLPGGEAVLAYTLVCGGLTARILSYGATLDSLWAPDRDGVPGDVLLGFGSLAERLAHSAYQGETVGRYANRIAGARFALGGKTYAVEANEAGRTCLHGGGEFSHANWAAEPAGEATLRLRYQSPAGSMGFPGAVEAEALFTLTAQDLTIAYSARSDAATPFNMTNHAYFNLACGGDVRGHVLQIDAESYLPIDGDSIPTGEVRPVAGTAFDFRSAKPIGRDLEDADPQLVQCKGYDHNYCLAAGGEKLAAVAVDPASGRRMQLYTDQPGVQLYTGNFLDSPGKNGVPQTQHSGFCLETQAWPDSPNRPEFASCLLLPGEEYTSKTVLKFGVV